MRRSAFPVILMIVFVASCGNLAADRSVVEGTGTNEFLKLRPRTWLWRSFRFARRNLFKPPRLRD